MNVKDRSTDNTAARDQIIASIRDSLATSGPFDAVRGGHSDGLTSSTPPTESKETAMDRFQSSLGTLGAHFHLALSEAEASEHVERLIERLGAGQVAISDSKLVATVVGRIPERQFVRNTSAATLFDCELGITSAQWAIAETGTLVLESERESSRLTSLVPAVHLCLLQATRIRHTLAEILELVSRDLSRTVTFITGASRTSDIELTLAIGVHGPGELHVVVLADQ